MLLRSECCAGILAWSSLCGRHGEGPDWFGDWGWAFALRGGSTGNGHDGLVIAVRARVMTAVTWAGVASGLFQ